MDMKIQSRSEQASPRNGLVLLVVLGMLALFSLLAITYLTFSGRSRGASLSMVKAKLQPRVTDIDPDMIIRKVIAGDTSSQSAFRGHSLLEDIYGRDPIEGQFYVPPTGSPRSALWNVANRVGLLKIQLYDETFIHRDVLRVPPATSGPDTPDESALNTYLSVENDTYTGRLITFLEGPLANETYRILGYVGNLSGTPPGLSHAIAIDLNETKSRRIEYSEIVNGQKVSYAGTLAELLARSTDPSFLIEKTPATAAARGEGYRFLINDLPFSGFGYGIERDPSHPSFGNLDQSRLVPGTNETSPGTYQAGHESFPIALLPNYDYLRREPFSGAIGSEHINGAGPIQEVTGSTNEGFDVADFHDYFLAHIPAPTLPATTINQGDVIPSFHRPELVNFIAQSYAASYGGLNSLTPAQVVRMVTLIDYACARPLSYVLRSGPNVIAKNRNFAGRLDGNGIPSLELDLNNWPSPAMVDEVEQWVQALTGGGGTSSLYRYDIDSDLDGIADTVWTDPNLPLQTSPEGRYLKVLAATMIIDLDGRINLNTAGDPFQLDYAQNIAGNYRTFAETNTDPRFSRRDPSRSLPVFLPQGLGYGPAEIFLPRLAGNQTASILNGRYGPSMAPGFVNTNDAVSRFFRQRELHFDTNGVPFGLRQARRGRMAYGVDLLGNARMSESSTSTNTEEILNEAYESGALSPSSDDTPFTLAEIEALLRRYEQDSSKLPSRVRRLISSTVPLNHEIFRSLTTRSVELRYPSMSAIGRRDANYTNPLYPRVNGPRGTGQNIPIPTTPDVRLVTNARAEGSMLRFIQMLYEERYTDRLGSNRQLELSTIRELFPLEFRKGLRLDINRPFGNGLDDDSDGAADDPDELHRVAQQERFSDGSTQNGTYALTNYPPTAPTNPDYALYENRLRSRKMLARQLYCMAQLLVAWDYPFGGLQPTATNSHDLTNATNRAYSRVRARELAQWAVNVVDFRDHDAAMTRFEYDEVPFELETGDSNVWEPKVDCVVWGLEFPELVMTENLSVHNKNVKDTADDTTQASTTSSTPDDDFDQYRIPQGSTYIEFLCTRSPNSPVTTANTTPQGRFVGSASSSLYNNNGELVLSTLAPATPSGITTGLPYAPDYGQQPVFRVGIARLPAGADPGTLIATRAHDQLALVTNQTSPIGLASTGTPLSAYDASGLTAQVSTTAAPSNNYPGQGTPLRFERMLWFTGNTVANNQSVPDLFGGEDPSDTNFSEREHRIFRNAATGALTLQGGQYLVVGPRAITHMGSLAVAGPPEFNPNEHRIEIGTAGGVDIYDHTGTSMRPTAWRVRSPQSMIAIASPPTNAWTQAPPTPPILNGGIGFNISEPTPSPSRYYQIPTTVLNAGATRTFPFTDSYADLGLAQKTLPDTPFDNDNTSNLERLAFENKQRPGTYPVHRTAYLQRLADPELPYHPLYNPYITIDWMNLDLTVFNGEDNDPTGPSPPIDETPQTTGYAFQSRYKDGARVIDAPNNQGIVPLTTLTTSPLRYAHYDPSLPDIQTGLSMFSSSTAYLVQSQAATSGFSATGDPYFKHLLGYPDPNSRTGPSSVTLGYINGGREDATNRSDGFAPPAPSSGGAITGLTTADEGNPQMPQAGLFWLNRPFASPYELMLVPRVGPGQLGQTFSTPRDTTTGRYENTNRAGPNYLPFFGHLPNFFSSELPKSTAGGNFREFWQKPGAFGTQQVGSNWNLLLELIETPSPYADAERWVHPNQVNGSGNIPGFLLSGYQTPFNSFSNYQAAGKVNFNTLTERGVWEAVEGNYDMKARTANPTSTKWNEFLQQRRGYTLPGTAGSFFTTVPSRVNPNLHASSPTQFTRPYRSGFGTNMEVLTLKNDRSVNRGILRPQLNSSGTPSNDEMLLAPDALGQQIDPTTPDPTLVQRVEAEFTRQPFSNFQRAMRLPNLATNQSNVFAVWVTIGLFEYDDVNGIGAEYIGAHGIPERTRAFYIIDRSIPVACDPGKTLNTERTILLRRTIPQR